MRRSLHIYDLLCLAGVALVAGTLGAAEMGSISETRMVFQTAFGLFVAGRYGLKTIRMFCRRADRRAEE